MKMYSFCLGQGEGFLMIVIQVLVSFPFEQ